jgi:hypothetical protein
MKAVGVDETIAGTKSVSPTWRSLGVRKTTKRKGCGENKSRS